MMGADEDCTQKCKENEVARVLEQHTIWLRRIAIFTAVGFGLFVLTNLMSRSKREEIEEEEGD